MMHEEHCNLLALLGLAFLVCPGPLRLESMRTGQSSAGRVKQEVSPILWIPYGFSINVFDCRIVVGEKLVLREANYQAALPRLKKVKFR